MLLANSITPAEQKVIKRQWQNMTLNDDIKAKIQAEYDAWHAEREVKVVVDENMSKEKDNVQKKKR